MDELYHYTGLAGFEAVVKSNSLRMTKSGFMNDPSDCNLLISLIEEYLNHNKRLVNDEISNLDNNTQVATLYHDVGCDLISYVKYLYSRIPLYVLSMTHNDDDIPI